METFKVVDKRGEAGSGTILYNPETQSYSVEGLALTNAQKKLVDDHLTKPRVFMIPQGPGPDEVDNITAVPVSDIGFFRLAMCTLFVNTGLWVNWGEG